jgi:hypothetical protein
MAASTNVSQQLPSHNSVAPTHGVVTLHGYGISVRVDRGHLLVEDGVGATEFSVAPTHGVVTLHGYGISVRVDRGHLLVEDGVGGDRRSARLPRVGHGLKRLVVIGSDGFVSLSALRWLADQDAAFVMLERDGEVLATTGPVRSSDARLRRAQALSTQIGHGARNLARADIPEARRARARGQAQTRRR